MNSSYNLIKKNQVVDAVSSLDSTVSVYFDFDFTITSADSEVLFLELMRSVSWGGERCMLNRKERLLIGLSRRFRFALYERLLEGKNARFAQEARNFFRANFVDTDLINLIENNKRLSVLSHCPENLLRFLILDDPRIVGRKGYSNVLNKEIFSSSNSVIFSDSESDFKGDWKECFLVS